jgi:hypothetical protein
VKQGKVKNITSLHMKVYGGMWVYLHLGLVSALDGGKLSASRPSCFALGRSRR